MKIKEKILDWVKGLLLATTLVLFACGDSEVNDQQLIQIAREYLDQNKIREAAIELRNALQGNPDNAEARYLLGMTNLDIGNMASAEKELRRAAVAGWPEGQVRIGQARVMIHSGAFQKLINEIEVKKNYSTNVRADLYALHALAQAGLGDLKQAGETLGKASAIDAKAFYVLKATIQMQFAAGDIESASKSLEHALTVHEDNQEILLLSASVALRNNDRENAASAYRKVIALDPVKLVTIYGRKARLALARLEILDKSFDQAKVTLKPLFKLYANDPETNFVGGLLAFELGNLDLAEQRLLTVLKVAPDHAKTQLLFGTVSYAQKDYEQAAYYIARYLSEEPENLGARKLLGRAYINLGQQSEAQAALQSGLKDGNDAELLALVGFSQLQSGDVASSIDGLERAVRKAPESQILRSNLARAYLVAGETEYAIKELNTILAEGKDNKQAEALLITAHLKAEQYDRAIDVVLEMFQKSPNDPAVISLTGNVFAASNDRVEARKYFNKALQIKPDYVPATMLLARIEEFDGYPAKAEALYKKLVDTNTGGTAPMMALARIAETQKRTEEMLGWLERARKGSPQDVKSRTILAEYYLREKQLEKIDPLIKEITNIAPRDNTLLFLQARLQMAKRQYNKALSTLSGLVTRVPDSVFARTMLGEVYFKLDQQADASRQLDIVFKKQPYYMPALLLMTNLKLRSGNYEEALEFAGKVQKVQPDLYIGYELAGDASLKKKDYIDAKTSYEQAWQRKRSAQLAIKISEVLAYSGIAKEVTKPLLDWLGDHPDDARVLQFLGTAYQNMKMNDKAIETFEKVLIIQPDNIVGLNNLAWLYSQANNPESIELAERAYKLSPNNAGIKDTYGWILVQQGQADKGLRLLEQVVKALPEVPEVQYHYGVALLKSGKKTEAMEILQRLLKDGKSFTGREHVVELLK